MAKTELEIKFNDGKYEDSLGRSLIIDRLAKCIYVVPKSQTTQFNIMRSRMAFVIALTMASMVFISLPVGVLVFISTFAIAEVLYRCFYLKKLQKITNVDLPSKPTLLERYALDNDGTMILMCLLSLALLVILPLYIKQEVGDLTQAIQFKNLNWSIIVYGSLILDSLAIYLIYATITILIQRRRKGD